MRKRLLICNATVYGILCSLSLLYVGFAYGIAYRDSYFDYAASLLFLPAVYLVLFLVACYQIASPWDVTGKGYCVTGTVALLFASVMCFLRWTDTFHLLLEGTPNTDIIDTVVFPAVILSLSAISTVFYFICAVLARKENQKVSN